jgi:translocation and assembly module TamB
LAKVAGTAGTNTGLLLQAADALNANGTNKILNLKNQIKKGLGLSDLDINTHSEVDPKTQETFQHTAFVLGKYLSPKFYINYSLDIFDHTNTLKVRYLLNKFWTIQSVANTNGSGIDVLYTFEK